jgi:hypothetical protein
MAKKWARPSVGQHHLDEPVGAQVPFGVGGHGPVNDEAAGVCHIDEGFDFLGWRVQHRTWRGRAGRRAVYTYPSKKSRSR